MSDFIAHVIAELDMSKAEAKMSAFTSKKHTVDVDVNLVSKNGNINNYLNQIKSQFGQAGNSAGTNFANSVNNSLGKINVKNAAFQIANLQRTLKSMNFSSSSIDTITKDLQEMELAVTKVTTRMNGQNLNVKVDGIDQMGRAVSVVKEFDAATGRMQRTSETVATSLKQMFTSADASKLNADITALDANFVKLKGSVNNESTALAKLKADLANISNINGLDRQQAEFERITQEVNKLSIAYKEAYAENQALVSSQQLMSKKTILGNQIQTWMNNNTKAAKIYRTELEQIQKDLASVGNASQLKAVSSAFNELKVSAMAAGNTGKTTLSMLIGNITKLSPLFGMGAMITTSIRAVRSMIDSVIALDTALVDLQKTTTMTNSELESFYSSANDVAKQMGVSTEEIISQAAAWSRLGYSSAEAAESMAKLSSQFASISPGMDVDTATDGLVSIMKAYNIDVDNVLDGIMSKINIIGNTAATSNADIVEMLTRSSSAMAEANNTLDETIALETAAVEITQDAASVGTAFKTLSMRIRGYDEETESFTNDVEKLSGEIADLTKTAKTPGGISLFTDDAKTEYKSTYQLLKEISEIYDDLTDKDQAQLLEALAGKRQGQVVAATIKNFSAAEEAMENMANSAGSADKEMSIIMDSLEYKLNALRETGVGIAQNLFQRDDMKAVVDMLTSALSLVEKITGKLGLFGTAFTGIFTAMSVRNAGLFTTIDTQLTGITNKVGIFGKSLNNIFRDLQSGQGITNSFFSKTVTHNDVGYITDFMKQLESGVPTGQAWQATMKNASVAGKQMAVQVKSGAVSLEELQMSANASKASMIGLRVATVALNMALSMGIAIAIQAVVTGLNNFIHAAKNASDSADELSQKSREHISELEEERDTIDELIQKYIELKNSDTQDATTRSEIAEIQSTITSLVGEQASNLDLVNGKLDEELSKLQQIQAETAKDNLQKAVANYKNAKESSNAAVGGDSYAIFDGYAYTGAREKNLEEVLKNAGYGGNVQSGGVFGSTLFVMDTFDNELKELKNAAEKAEYIKGMIDTIENSGENYSDSSLYAGLVDQYNAYIDYVNSQSEAASKLVEFAADYLQYDDKLSKMTVDSAESLQKYRDTMVDSIMDLPQLEAAIADGAIDRDSVESYVDSWLGSIEKYSDYYNELENESTDAADVITQANQKITESIEKASETTTNLVAGITSAQSALSNQKNGKSVSLDNFNSDELKDYRSALEYVNGTMQLNSEKVKEIVQAKADEQVAINNTNKALEQAKYLENAKQIEQYRQKLRDANFAEGETKESIQASIDALLNENSAIADTCKQYDLLSSSIREAIGEYQNWLNAQSASDYGDMASDAVSAIEQIRDTYNSESDIYGNFGSKKFDAAVDFIVPDSVDRDDLGAIESYMADFKQYLKFDDDGNAEGLNIDKFLENAVNAGLMSYSDDDGFQVLGGKKMEDFAEGLNMSSGMVQAFFDELQLKGAEFDWGDEAVKTIGDLALEANEAAESLRQVEGNGDLKIKMDVSDLATTEEQISALDATIAEMDSIKAKPGVDSSDIDNANAVIQYCLTQKQLLSQPDVMRVDTSQVEGDIGNAIALLQQFQTAQDNLEIKQKIGADTSEAQAEVDSLTQQIQGISPDIKAKLSIDTTSTESISSSIAELSAETIHVKAEVDASAISGYDPESKTCDVIYDPKTDLLPESFSEISRTVNYVPVTSNLPDSFRTITRYVNYVKTGDVSVNGTAHVGGTAKASGDWGTAPGGRTLVGELGREIVVDPHTGKWYTVGDTGAEFRDIPAGAIVFNHIQSEELLKNGYVSGRASALVSGTALVTGGYKPYKPSGSVTSTSTKTTASKNSSYGSPVKSSSSSSSNSSKSDSKTDDDDFEEKFDLVEIALKRIGEAIDRLKIKAESTFKSLSKRNSAAADEISMITEKINLQNSAYNRYMQQANSVGLSSDWVEKIKNGSIDISTVTDEDLADKIKEFQDFYDKAIECKDAVAELHEEIAQLYANRFNNIQSDFEHQLSLVEHLINTYNTGLDTLEAKGLMGSKVYYQALQKAEKENQEILTQELVDLTESFNQAMASGEIEKNSEQWYEMQESINSAKEALDESNLSLLEFEKTMRELDWEYFDFMEKRISTITDEGDFLVDLMANRKLFDDKGYMTDTGMATMGLHGQNYNVYMAQADQYANEIKSLNEEIANDPYNTDLIERRQELLELQRKAILAAEDEKQAISDLVEDGINAQLDALKELIDIYTDSLDSAKDLYDYQKKVKDQTSEIASLQKQLSAYSGDTSEETRATIQKLEVDLSKAMEELQETEYDQYISDQKKMLDDLYTEYETILNQRLDDVNVLISDMIDTINANSSTIGNTIMQECANVGYTLTDSMNAIWTNEGGAFAVISKYGEQFLTQNTSTLNAILGIKAYTDSLIAKADAEAKAKEEATKKQTEASKPATQPAKPATSTSTPAKSTTPTRTDKDNYGVALAIWNGNYGWGTGNTRVSRLKAKGFDPNKVQSIVNKMGKDGYIHSGAWVGKYYGIRDLAPYHYNKYAQGLKRAIKDEDAWVNELDDESIISPTKRAIITHISKGDSVLNGDATDNIWDMANDPSGFIGKNLVGNSILSGIEPYMHVNNNSVGEVTFNLPNVTNYEDFMNRARKDEKFEDMIQSMTIGVVAGKSTLAKNKYKW